MTQPEPTVTITVRQLEEALRGWLAQVDYDLHKAMQCNEETGEDTYPDEADGVFEHLQRITAAAAAASENTTETDGEPETSTRPCGHDDYHDPHEWADRPGIWCPGHSHADTAPAAAGSAAANEDGQPTTQPANA